MNKTTEVVEANPSIDHMACVRRNRSLYAGFGLIFLSFVGVAVSSFVGFQTFQESSRWIIHFEQVRQAPLHILTALQDMENVERKYILTGRQGQPAIYETLKTFVRDDFKSLLKLFADDPEQLKNPEKMKSLVDEYVASMDMAIASFQKGDRKAALSQLNDPRNKKRMERIIEEEDAIGDGLIIGRGKIDETHLDRAVLTLSLSFISTLLLSLVAVYLILRELGTRQRIQKELLEQENNFRHAISSIQDYAIVTLNERGIIQSWNEGARKIKGYASEEILGKNFSCLYTEEDIQSDRPGQLLRRAAQKGCAEEETWRVRRDGTHFLADITLTALRGERDGVRGFIEVTRDITEVRKDQRQQLRRKDEQLNALMENAHDAIFILGADGQILNSNLQGEKLLKMPRTAMLGRCYLDFTMPSEKPRAVDYMGRVNLGEKPAPEEFQLIQSDGNTCWVEFSVVLILLDNEKVYFAIGRDVTDRKIAEENLRRSEERLRETQKLEAIGQLSAGIAHDFNNILNVVSGNGELLLMDMKEDDPNREEVLEIQKSVFRGAELTRQLLLFGRREVSQPTVLKLNGVITETLKMLARMIGEDLELIVKGDKDLHPILADTTQIQQILMNLLGNARDAMPQGGKILVETRNMVIEEDMQKGQELILKGSYVLLSVSDTGTGMDAEVQKRIFEPFFTTKEIGKGTGLGLATVYGVVKKSNGHIWVYSEKGNGTSFNILFPAVEQAETPIVTKPKTASVGGFETLLLVEDEAGLRAIMARTLEKQGYVVIQARDGQEGLDKAVQYLQKIDLVVTDTVMPRMSGKVLVDKIHELRPELKAIFTSGYPRQILSNQGIVDPNIQLILKPFTNELLLNKVREVLDSRN